MGENGHEHAEEKHGAGDGDEGGDDAQAGALVVAEVAGIGEAQEGPPYGLGGIAERLVGAVRDEKAEGAHTERDEGDEDRTDGEAGESAAEQEPLDDELNAVAERIDDHPGQLEGIESPNTGQAFIGHGAKTRRKG